jgi:site-specific DNA-methyltransferase (adenine-specific)/adenine-specific DNA-methyltransferase
MVRVYNTLSKPKNTLEADRLYNADAFDVLSQCDDKSVDLIICDGPYGVTTNEWDRIGSIQEFNLNLIKIFSQKLKPGGALYLFGKPDCIDFIDYRPYLNLRSKIIWYQPSRLAQGRLNYTNNYDTICYFIKGGRPKTYDLDAIRVSQLVELEHRLRCERVPSVVNGQYGKTKFNEQGKNPGDVWGDIKQLTYKSKELASREALNTIQKPERLMDRLIKASSAEGDLILDPFAGVGTALVVCKKLGRHFIGIEQNSEFVKIAKNRIAQVEKEMKNETLQLRNARGKINELLITNF